MSTNAQWCKVTWPMPSSFGPVIKGGKRSVTYCVYLEQGSCKRYSLLYFITILMRMFWLVNQLWFIVPVESLKNGPSSEFVNAAHDLRILLMLFQHLGLFISLFSRLPYTSRNSTSWICTMWHWVMTKQPSWLHCCAGVIAMVYIQHTSHYTITSCLQLTQSLTKFSSSVFHLNDENFNALIACGLSGFTFTHCSKSIILNVKLSMPHEASSSSKVQ